MSYSDLTFPDFALRQTRKQITNLFLIGIISAGMTACSREETAVEGSNMAEFETSL